MKKAVLVALLFSWLALGAEEKATSLSDAHAAVEANMKTQQGKAYDEKFGNEVMQRYLAGMRQCLKNGGGDAKSFWMLFKLKQDGSVGEILLAPATPAGSCDRDLLLKSKFSPPPRDDYWQGMYLNTGH